MNHDRPCWSDLLRKADLPRSTTGRSSPGASLQHSALRRRRRQRAFPTSARGGFAPRPVAVLARGALGRPIHRRPDPLGGERSQIHKRLSSRPALGATGDTIPELAGDQDPQSPIANANTGRDAGRREDGRRQFQLGCAIEIDRAWTSRRIILVGFSLGRGDQGVDVILGHAHPLRRFRSRVAPTSASPFAPGAHSHSHRQKPRHCNGLRVDPFERGKPDDRIRATLDRLRGLAAGCR